MLTIDATLMILTGYLQDHQTHYSSYLNNNPDIKYEATIKNHHLQKAKNHLYDVLTPPTPGDYCTTTSSSDVRIIDNMNMHRPNSPPTAVYFPTQTTKQDKSRSLSAVSTLQIGQYVTYIGSNGTWFPEIITKVMICTISGDPI